MRLSQVLEHARADGNRRHALGHGLHKAVECTGLTVPLGLVAAAAEERTNFSGQSLERKEVLDMITLFSTCGLFGQRGKHSVVHFIPVNQNQKNREGNLSIFNGGLASLK